MKFFLVAALAGVAFCQQGAQGSAPTAVASNRTASAAGASAAPTSKPKGKAKGGKKGKKGKTPAPTAAAPSPTPAAEVVITSEPQVFDSSCRGAPIGSLWCAAKRKCLRAWEEPCEQFGDDTQTHVQVKEGSPVLYVPRAADTTVATTTTTTTATATASIPLYPPRPATAAGVIYQPVVTASVYNGTAAAQPLAPIGGNTDNGGCYTGAGYSFCATLGICVRPWETPCPDVAPITAPVVPAVIDPVGGQRDANGCVIGAGYTFCAPLNTCVRSWETPCPVTTEAAVQLPLLPGQFEAGQAEAAVQLPLLPPPIGGQVDAGGCMAGAGYTYCASLARCVRSWETPCPGAAASVAPVAPVIIPGPIGGSRDAGGCVTGAGYTFCSSLNRCVRSWETPCPV